MESLTQTGSDADYQSQFEQLAHNILRYNPSYDDVYFVTRFLAGLKEEIRAPITLHCPPNLEVAGTLALLQESELEMARGQGQYKPESKEWQKDQSKSSSAMDKNKFRKDGPKPTEASASSGPNEKLAALKAFRKENNLCFVCGEK